MLITFPRPTPVVGDNPGPIAINPVDVTVVVRVVNRADSCSLITLRHGDSHVVVGEIDEVVDDLNRTENLLL